MSDRSDYFEKARNWATETRSREARLRRIAFTVAGIAAGIALFEAVALALLVPLKTVEPITLLVDRQTGYVQALDPLQPRRIGADAALTQSFLAQYVVAREGFDRATVAHDYRRVALWSAGLARSQYLASMPASNPASPFARYPDGMVVVTRVKSVSPLSEGTAMVRFDTERQDRSGGVGPAQPWIAVIRYRYSDAPMAFEDRLVNPLGFQVASYRRDPEAPPLPPAQTANTEQAQAPQRVAMATPPYPSVASRSEARANVYGAREIVRNVSINQIPMGSPLESHPDSYSRPIQGGQP